MTSLMLLAKFLLLALHLERGDTLLASPWWGRGHVLSRPAAAATEFVDSGSIRESGSIYGAPELYDLAFSYRDFDSEVRFLLEAHRRHAGSGGARTAAAEGPSSSAEPMRVLELAAGPARHCLLGATEHGIAATALDCSVAMAEYGRSLAAKEAALREGGPGALRYVLGDMRAFSAADLGGGGGGGGGDAGGSGGGVVDSVWCLLGSAGHLLTNEDWVGMFSSAAGVLAPGGTLILELPHPRETFRLEDVTSDGWDVPEGDDNPLGIGLAGEDGGILGVQWGRDDDPFDPLTQVRQASVELELERQGAIVQRVREVVPQRELGLQELRLLAAASGGYSSANEEEGGEGVGGALQLAVYGAMDLEVPLDDDEEAFRLVAVFTKAP